MSPSERSRRSWIWRYVLISLIAVAVGIAVDLILGTHFVKNLAVPLVIAWAIWDRWRTEDRKK
ncbi:hypothetical protein [Actinoplanes sp. HUAS TT8]|uniref:hypothetical protein n=1 Tax=Actinoplanes sp. HUAS TT8 TaxID=3447453 RepID=UPI003F51D5E6